MVEFLIAILVVFLFFVLLIVFGAYKLCKTLFGFDGLRTLFGMRRGASPIGDRGAAGAGQQEENSRQSSGFGHTNAGEPRRASGKEFDSGEGTYIHFEDV